MATRAALPEWPRLMDAEMAAAYFGLSAGTFRALGIQSRSIGRRVVWDRVDLDRYADRLSGQPLTALDRAAEASEVERNFLERRRG
ncbi:hypothetical protein [Sphingobium sp. WCS2017Hpa-17]|uniref:hypothetical protein n=1 Tax=Sphingobium sp. WCS2017Hpa-17 TaxID=3073638 RepID=UPI00288A7436|nr:hypothetical protein [Sphingobium sp. WCS2017Hpa-17]